MSQAQPTPKQSFLQTLLLFMVIFLGFQLMCPNVQEKRDPVTILSVVRDLHKQFAITKTGGSDLVSKMTAESAALQKRFDQQEPTDKLTPAQKEDMATEAQVLVNDAQLKLGIRTKNFDQLQMAYHLLSTLEPKMKAKPVWSKEYQVNPMPGLERPRASLKQLYVELEERARLYAKDALVWGFMPGYKLIDGLVNMTGAVPWFSYAFAALLLAFLVRGLVWPLAQKQYMWSRQMAQLQPLVKELRDKYQGQELNVKLMDLYKQYGINPAAGCGPILLQMPLFFLIYSCMLLYRFEFREGSFLWISQAGADMAPGFIAPNLGERDFILLVLYGISMMATTLLTPVSDPSNLRQQRIMGIGITLVFTAVMFTPIFPVPAAFVLYWIFTNLITTYQMIRAYRLPLPPLVKVATATGGVIPKASKPASPVAPTGNGMKATGAPKLHKPKKRKK
ncbi:MAG: membrane protein insertase YidC [Fimbriimonadaceae bacterium]